MLRASPDDLAIELEGISRRFGNATALAGIDLAVRNGEFFSLLGPSGCGKTTLLRLIAGLDYPDAGSVRIGGVDALEWPAHRRPVNTVFQSYALFPHLTVEGNVAFGLRMRRLPKAEIGPRVERVLDTMQIGHLSGRKPARLSGGEKQRVALARAIVNEPRILLLDEPLGALDLKLRRQLQIELRELQRRLGITFLYVTHDQEEALALSDRIAVLNAGRVEQVGTGKELYERPVNRFVAQFLGGCNLIEAEVRSRAAEQTVLFASVGELRIQTAVSGEKVTLAIRPEKIELEVASAGAEWARAAIREIIYSGAQIQYLLELNGCLLKATRLNDAGFRALNVGQSISVRLPPEALVALTD